MDVAFRANPTLLPGQVNVTVEAREFNDEAQQVLKSVQALDKQRIPTIPVSTETGLELVRKSDIVSLEVQGNLILIHVLIVPKPSQGSQTRVVATVDTLVHFLRMLPPTFIRISKQAAINVSLLQSLEASYSGNMMAFLEGGVQETVSRRYVDDLRVAIGV